MTRISLVAPAYNAERTLPALLESIERQTLRRDEWEALIVDDGSTDATAQLLKRHPRVTLLRQSNRGPGAARNFGTRCATGDVIVYTDADCQLPPDHLQRHLELHEEWPQLDGVCGSVAPTQRLPLGSAVLADHLCSWFNAHADLPPREPEYLWGANMSVKRRVPDAGVAWSEERVTGEDVDYSLQMRARKMRTLFSPDLKVLHTDRANREAFLRHQYNWGVHAPFVRGRNPAARYSFLFPSSPHMAKLLSPVIVLGYTALIVKAWRRRPIDLLSCLPLIVRGKIEYARGVIEGARTLKAGLGDRVADRRAA